MHTCDPDTRFDLAYVTVCGKEEGSENTFLFKFIALCSLNIAQFEMNADLIYVQRFHSTILQRKENVVTNIFVC